MPKLILIPEAPCIVEGNKQLVPMPFAKWVEATIDLYGESGHGLANIKRALRLVEKASQANGSLTIDIEDHKFLVAAMNAAEFSPRFARATLPYFEAVDSAKEV